MKNTAILLMIITVFSKIFGFLRDQTLSFFYGTSQISDAYLIAISIPNFIFSFIGIGISTGFIPMFNKVENEFGKDESYKFTNNLINIIVLITSVLVVFGLIFTEQLVKLMASGFEGETLALATTFTRIGLIGILFTGVMYVFMGFLQLKGNYYIPALVGFPMNIVIIISIYLSAKFNVIILSIGIVISSAIQLLLLIPFVRREGYRHSLEINFKDKHIIRMAIISIPLIIGASVNQINVLFDQRIATNIMAGGVSALNYANRLALFIHGLFVLTISTSMYPRISKMASLGRMDELKRTISEAINSMNIFLIPSTIGAMIFAQPIIRLLFGRGEFDEAAIATTSIALFFYSIGIIGYGIREILSKAFYSLQDTKTPMINAAIAMVINITLNYILSRYLGLGGLALATSISALVSVLMLFISFKRRVGSFGYKKIFVSGIKLLISSIIMGLTAKLLFDFLSNNIGESLSLIVSVGMGGIIYFVLIYLFKIEEVRAILDTIKQKLAIKTNDKDKI